MEETQIIENDGFHTPSSQEIKENSWKIISTVLLGALVVAGITFSNILHFWIEDLFNQPIVSSLYFGTEYAISMSWLLITGIMFLGLLFYQRLLIKKEKFSINFPFRKFLLVFALVAVLLASCYYFVRIVYGYFSGQSDLPGLFRILITISLNFLGGAYVFLELRYSKELMPKLWFYTICLCVFISMGTGLIMTMRLASPLKMRELQHDLKKVEALGDIRALIKNYYSTYSKLPGSLEELGQSELIEEKTLKDPDGKFYLYKQKSNGAFSLGATFSFDKYEARRLRSYKNSINDYKAGTNVFNYIVNKNKDGHIYIELQIISEATTPSP